MSQQEAANKLHRRADSWGWLIPVGLVGFWFLAGLEDMPLAYLADSLGMGEGVSNLVGDARIDLVPEGGTGWAMLGSLALAFAAGAMVVKNKRAARAIEQTI